MLDHRQLPHSSFPKRGTGGRDGQDGGGRACERYEEQLERVASEDIDPTKGLGREIEAKVPEIHNRGALQDDEFASR